MWDHFAAAEPVAEASVRRDPAAVNSSTVKMIVPLERAGHGQVHYVDQQEATQLLCEAGFGSPRKRKFQDRTEPAFYCSWPHLPWENHLTGVSRWCLKSGSGCPGENSSVFVSDVVSVKSGRQIDHCHLAQQ
jgi:hypothetical protein